MGPLRFYGGMDIFRLQPNMPKAACRDHPYLPWIPDHFSGRNVSTIKNMQLELATMKSICASCVHLIECRDYAMANETVYGVWGGMSSGERRAARQGKLAI